MFDTKIENPGDVLSLTWCIKIAVKSTQSGDYDNSLIQGESIYDTTVWGEKSGSSNNSKVWNRLFPKATSR